MLLNRRLIILIAALGTLFILYGGSTLWVGAKAEQTLQDQHRILAGLTLFKVKAHSYQRGWFSSKETTELVFNRAALSPYEDMLPNNIKPLLNASIKLTNHVKHGPLPSLLDFDFRPARALVRTEFGMSASTRKNLAIFFGEKNPISISNRLNFGGGGELKVKVPDFDYEEALSGVSIKWKGFALKLDYDQRYNGYQTEARSPGFQFQVASKGGLAFNGVRYLSGGRSGKTGVKLGTSELSVREVRLDSRERVLCSIKLNELVYLVTRVRIGDFINPSREFQPSAVTLKDFRYQIVTSEQGDYVNTRGKLNFAEFNLNENRYGPMRFDVSANHLHGPTLVKLDQVLGQVPFEGVDPLLLRKQYIDAIKKNSSPLLRNDPHLVINDFYLKLPSGAVKLEGRLGVRGLLPSDLNDATQFIRRFEVGANLSLPRQTLERMVIAQAQTLFTVDQSAEEQPNMKEVEDLTRTMLGSQLAEWKEEQYITEDQGQLNSSFNYGNGILTINRKRVMLPWEVKKSESPGGGSLPRP